MTWHSIDDWINLLCRYFLWMVLLTAPVFLTGQELFSEPGTVDLRYHDFDQGRIVALNGEWLFAPGNDLSRIRPVKVPGSWGRSGLPEQGRGTYLLRILLAEDAPPISVRFGYIHSSSLIKANGQVLLENGVPGNSPSETVPQWAPALLSLSPDKDGVVRLEIDVANFSHTKGGIPGEVELGATEDLGKRWELNRPMETTMTGLIFLLRYKDRVAPY